MIRLNNNNGFGLIEVTIIIITIGIMASIAMQSMTVLITDARQVKTEREMELLADAIIGNADISAGNQRGDFGYIGDVGSFPPNLDALIINPGGYTTWDGPYISTQFTQDTDGYKTDEWGNAYTYTGGLTISSNGSGTIITKKIADATTDYTLNNFNGTILDASGTTPGTTYLDSININITIPNGAGGTTSRSYLTNASGVFTLDSLPVGQHPLRIIYTPNVDTLYSILTILPRHKSNKTFKFASSYFTSGGSGGGGGGLSGSGSIKYVNSTAQTTGGNCDKFNFDIINTTGSPITITSLTPQWASPTAYFKEVEYNGDDVYEQENPRIGSGSTATFDNPKTINAGQTINIQIEGFRDQPTNGNKVNMSNTDFTITFSDGSVITFNTGSCN